MKRSRLKRWNDSSGAWRRLAAAAAVAGLLSGTSAHAVEFGGGMAQLHGFASQTFITTADNNFFGETSDNGHFGFTELGLNGSFRPSPNLQAAAQLLSRRAGEDDDGDVRFDYALVDYSPLSDARNRLGLRAGFGAGCGMERLHQPANNRCRIHPEIVRFVHALQRGGGIAAQHQLQ